MTPKERAAALTTLDRQERPQPPALEGETLSGLRCLFGETDRLLVDATERLQISMTPQPSAVFGSWFGRFGGMCGPIQRLTEVGTAQFRSLQPQYVDGRSQPRSPPSRLPSWRRRDLSTPRQ